MDKLMFIVSLGGLFWSFKNMGNRATASAVVASGSLVVMNIAVTTMVMEQNKNNEVKLIVQK